MLKPVIPAAVGTIVPILGALIILVAFPVGLLALGFLPVFMMLQKNKVEEWGRAREYAGAVQDGQDQVFTVASLQQIRIEKALARMKVTIQSAGRSEVFYLEPPDADRLRQWFPALIAAR